MHWLIAVLIVTAWFTGDGAEVAMEAVEEGGVAGFVPHVAVGLSILALVVVRIALYYQYVLKDGLLRRMMKAGRTTKGRVQIRGPFPFREPG